jgi:hypothetical protein
MVLKLSAKIKFELIFLRTIYYKKKNCDFALYPIRKNKIAKFALFALLVSNITLIFALHF